MKEIQWVSHLLSNLKLIDILFFLFVSRNCLFFKIQFLDFTFTGHSLQQKFQFHYYWLGFNIEGIKIHGIFDFISLILNCPFSTYLSERNGGERRVAGEEGSMELWRRSHRRFKKRVGRCSRNKWRPEFITLWKYVSSKLQPIKKDVVQSN